MLLEQSKNYKALILQKKGERQIIGITEDDCFLENYHNFLDEIVAGGKKIN